MAKTTKTAKKSMPAAKKNGKSEVVKTSKKTVSAKTVKSEKSEVAKKAVAAKTAVAKKTAPAKAAKKTVVAKKAVAAKTALAKKTAPAKVAKKTVVAKKTTVAKTAVAKKTAPAKAAKKTVVAKKTTVAKTAVAKKTAPSKVAKKTVVAKKAVAAKPTAVKKTAIVKKEELREKQIKETMDKVKNAHHFENIDEEWGDYTPPIVGFTRYSDADLKMFKDLINKKLADAKEELNFYKEQLIENAMNETDSKSAGLEDGGQTNEKEYLNNMANRQMKFISNLENALIRIENKTYGICRKTGELIDKKRLMAVPHATLSMDAKLGK